MFNFKIHAKFSENSCKKGTTMRFQFLNLDLFCFYIPCAFCFCILKIHAKKGKEKKFQIAKIYMQKNIIILNI